jgi:hypothetical protein
MENFIVAFTVRDFATQRVLDDPLDFRFKGLLVEGTAHNAYQNVTSIGVHKCTKEDEAQFYPSNF